MLHHFVKSILSVTNDSFMSGVTKVMEEKYKSLPG